MTFGFAALPDAERYVLANATLPSATVAGFDGVDVGEGLMRADIVIAGAKIEALRPAGSVTDLPLFDLDHGQVWPALVDMHTHLDKGHILGRTSNPNGTFEQARESVRIDREAHWSADDVRARMDFALRSAYAHGTKLIRTHLDSAGPQAAISWPVFAEMRETWAGRIDLQGSALVMAEDYLHPEGGPALVEWIARNRGMIGAVTFGSARLEEALDHIFYLASEHELDVDFHVDETEDPNATSLRSIAEAALRIGFEGQIVAGHCCSLARQPDDEADRTMDLVAAAGISVVSLPMCNMYLQDRHPGRTPRWRGVTLLHEMTARGIPVAVASDNTRDPFYAYGDLDGVEVFREAVRILQLDHPLDAAPSVVTTTPAAALRRPDCGRIEVGADADLLLFRSRSWSEFLSRPQTDRTVIRAGKAIDRTLPDYRELDSLAGR